MVTDCLGNRIEPPEPKKLIAILEPASNHISNCRGRIISVHDSMEKAQRANRKRLEVVTLNREMDVGATVFSTDIDNPKRRAANDRVAGELFKRVWGQR
jgi:hypothetical protein